MKKHGEKMVEVTIDEKDFEIVALKNEVKRLTEINDGNVKNGETWKRQSTERGEEIKTQRKAIDDLKRELADTKIENARLNGYIERVQEHDQFSEPPVEVGERVIKEFQTRRPPVQYGGMGESFHQMETDEYGRRIERKHWTAR